MRMLTCYTQYRGQPYEMTYSVPATIVDEKDALAQATIGLNRQGIKLISYEFYTLPQGAKKFDPSTLNTGITLIEAKPY